MTDAEAVRAQLARWREVAVEAREHSARGVAATGEALDALPLLLDALGAAMATLDVIGNDEVFDAPTYARATLAAIAATLEGPAHE